MDLGGLSDLLGLLFLLLFVGLMVASALVQRRRALLALRQIPAFTRLREAIGLAVEDGTRLHLSLGSGEITGPNAAAGFVGLSMLRRVADITSVSDHPPIATTGDGALAILAQDTLQTAYRQLGAEDQYDPNSVRLTGATPFSYTSGTMPVIADELVSTNLLAGTFAVEAALITTASDRRDGFTLAGTDNLAGQAMLYAAAQEPLIGEELYAGGAYLQAGAFHEASLHAQDAVRYLLIAVIVVGGLLRFLGVL